MKGPSRSVGAHPPVLGLLASALYLLYAEPYLSSAAVSFQQPVDASVDSNQDSHLASYLPDGESAPSTSSFTNEQPGPAGKRSWRPPTRGPQDSPTGYDANSEADEDEDLYNTEELEVVNLLRAEHAEEREQQEARGPGGIRRLVKSHISVQLFFWGSLTAAVYLIMRGATREDEKQQSLDVHKMVLKSMMERLRNEKEEKLKLLRERQRIQQKRLVLYRHSLGVSGHITNMVAEIQDAVAQADIHGRVQSQQLPQPPHGKKQQRRQHEDSSLAVPTIEEGCRPENLPLHLVLLHQGDAEYQEATVRRFLKDLEELKQRQEKQQGEQQSKGLDFGEALAWYEAAALSVNLHPGKIASAKSSNESGGRLRSATRERHRKIALLAVGSVMLKRKEVLENELQDIKSALRKLSDAEKDLAASVKTKGGIVTNLVDQNLKATKEDLLLLEKQFIGNTEVEESAKGAAWKAVQAVPNFTGLFGEAPQGAHGASKEIHRTGEARRRLFASLRTAIQLLALQEKRLATAVEVGMQDDRYKLYVAFRESLEKRYQKTATAIATLHAAQIAADGRKKENVVAIATQREREKIVAAQLEATDRWLANAQKAFDPPEEQSPQQQ